MTLESDAKFEEKLTCGLENNMRNFGKLSPEQLHVGTQYWDFYEAENRKVENVRA